MMTAVADRRSFRPSTRMVALANLFVLSRAAGMTRRTIRPTDPVLKWIGRTAVVHETNETTGDEYDSVMYDMPGVEVRFNIRGTTEVYALIQQNWAEGPADAPSTCSNNFNGNRPNNFLVFQNGVRDSTPDHGSTCFYCTFDTGAYFNSSKPETYRLVHGLDPRLEYEIWLSKDSEADFDSCEAWPNWVRLHSLLLSGPGVVEILPVESVPLLMPLPEHKIEIIGGSTTSGYCNLCGLPWNAPHKTPNDILKGTSLHKSWVGQMCGFHGMNAECIITAWSGMGVATSQDENTAVHLPTIFNRTVQSMPDEGNQWNFSSWRPDVVILDIGMEDRDRGRLFKEKYRQLVHHINYWYGKSATGHHIKIIMGCGMTDPSYCDQIREMVQGFIAIDGIYAYYLDLTRSGLNNNVCCNRPDKQTHEDLGEYVSKEVLRVINSENGPRSARGPLAVIIMLVCLGTTLLIFLVFTRVQRCRRSAREDSDSDDDASPQSLQESFRPPVRGIRDQVNQISLQQISPKHAGQGANKTWG